MAHAAIIPAFLASPGDLADEREDAREIVERVNTMMGAALGFRIELYGWEDQPPGYGRPQGQINPRVDDAELFIGLVWRRWGTPPGEGFTSGFEEEYRRAVGRRESGDANPRIWLFFKDVDPGQASDPGEELQKVLSFQAVVQSEREALYRTFSSRTSWREQLYELLSQFLAERSRSQGAPLAQTERSLPPAPDKAPEALPTTGARRVNAGFEQLVGALDAAIKHLRTEAAQEPPDAVSASRLLLASFDWVSRAQNANVLGTHEAHLLFRLSSEVELTSAELLQLMRSLVTGGDVRPGWAWVDDLPAGVVYSLLGWLARTDRNPEVRLGALRTLGDASLVEGTTSPDAQNLHESEWGAAGLLRVVSNDADLAVRREGLKMLGRAATDEAVAMLRSAMEVPQLRSAATEGVIEVLRRRDPGEALRFIAAEDPYVPENLRDELLARTDDYDEESVNALAASVSSANRQLALRIADATGRC